MFKFLKKLKFSAPYKWEERHFLYSHFLFVFIASILLFAVIYTYNLKTYINSISINDWPMPQPEAKNATFYCNDPEECEVFAFYETNLVSVLPSILDLVIFSFSLSIDSICFGGKMSKYRYYYTILALIKNAFTITLILKRSEFADLQLDQLGLFNTDSYHAIDNISSFFQWVYGIFLKFAPIWSLHNFLFLTTVTAFVKFYKNVQDLKYYFNVKAKSHYFWKFILCLLQIFYKILFLLLIIYTICSCLIAIVLGFGIGILVVPLMISAVIIFGALLSFPFHLLSIYFQKPKKINNKEAFKELQSKDAKKNNEIKENLLENELENSQHEEQEEDLEEKEGVEEEINILTEEEKKRLFGDISNVELAINDNNQNQNAIDQNDNNIKKSVNWREVNRKLIEQRQKNFALIKNGVIVSYCSLAVHIIFFEIFNWSSTMKFCFSLPYLGFNIYRFDVGSSWDNAVSILTFLLNII